MNCCSFEEMVEHVDSQLIAERSAAIAEHLLGCAACRDLQRQIQEMAQGLSPQKDEFADPQLAQDVLTLIRLGQAKENQRQSVPWFRRWFVWTAPIAIAAAAVLIFSLSDRTPEFGKRSSATDAESWLELKIFKSDPSGYTEVKQRIYASDALAFAYANQATEADYNHLMVFAVDPAGSIYWYYPAHVDAERDPTSVAICGDCPTTPLPDEVAHQLRPGLLRMFAVFSSEQLRVSQVESRVARDLAQAGGLESLLRLNLQGTGQKSRLLQVSKPVSDASQMD